MTDPRQIPINLQDIRFGYHRHQVVVDDISTRLMPGQVHALIGPNASGKTTLLRLMLGQLRPTSGRILLYGRKIHRIRASRRASLLSYVPQRSSVNFAFSVRQVVEMGRFALPRDPRAVDEAIDNCELHDIQSQPFTELSAGQQQRVLLARAEAQSVGEGRIMLLDEPVSSMDLVHIHRTMTQLRRLAAKGLAVVVVLHDLNLAGRYADQIWILDRGRLVACGDWATVLKPSILEPVYGVKIRALRLPPNPAVPGDATQDRPFFDIRLPSPTASM